MNVQEQIDKMDEKILAETVIISNNIRLWTIVFAELIARTKWWQFWRPKMSEEEIQNTVSSYIEFGKEHPHYKPKRDGTLDWIILDSHNAVKESVKNIKTYKKYRDTLIDSNSLSQQRTKVNE